MINTTLYKLNLLVIKYMPITLALLDLIHTTLSYFNVKADCISYCGGISVLTLIYLYITSYCFKFCEKHRLPLHYVVCSNSIALYDTYYDINVTDFQLLCLYFIMFGIFIILYLFYNQLCSR